jgi:hypothetical protein
MIIKPRADQLKPGDILPAAGHRPRRVVTRVIASPSPAIVLHVVSIEPPAPSVSPQPPFAGLAPEQYTLSEFVSVEVPDHVLTPAQARADDLVESLLECVGCIPVGEAESKRAWALLDAVRPPVPPTMGEVLVVLAQTTSHARMCGAFERAGHVIGADADAILDRARRSGLLPNG